LAGLAFYRNEPGETTLKCLGFLDVTRRG